jgi:hypothetical protein
MPKVSFFDKQIKTAAYKKADLTKTIKKLQGEIAKVHRQVMISNYKDTIALKKEKRLTKRMVELQYEHCYVMRELEIIRG